MNDACQRVVYSDEENTWMCAQSGTYIMYRRIMGTDPVTVGDIMDFWRAQWTEFCLMTSVDPQVMTMIDSNSITGEMYRAWMAQKMACCEAVDYLMGAHA